ncbi:unnamed protein product [Rhizophagus irregularis]|uniref:Uncharacterized protein n=1 Tax=Rhizophagus irregularis TaxID=588596 RepID=A0A916E2I5_9GLOM|nr:unnamed protein product [Rhizophagus irregularis]
MFSFKNIQRISKKVNVPKMNVINAKKLPGEKKSVYQKKSLGEKKSVSKKKLPGEKKVQSIMCANVDDPIETTKSPSKIQTSQNARAEA